MLGLGETDEEILEAMKDLRKADVDVVTFGASINFFLLLLLYYILKIVLSTRAISAAV